MLPPSRLRGSMIFSPTRPGKNALPALKPRQCRFKLETMPSTTGFAFLFRRPPLLRRRQTQVENPFIPANPEAGQAARDGHKKNGTLVPYSYPLSARSHFNEPPTISSNSEVIACWRILLYCNCKSSNNLPALSFAICMARIRAACSEVWFSNNARTIVA